MAARRHARRRSSASSAAIARQERIAIHGDYDVDGITSTVILRRALELLGADVVHFIPERLKDGYGLQPAAIERLHADGVALVVSVDCGIRGAEAARRARELGVDLIITDHHEPDAELPPALAVINPKRHDCTLSGQAPGRRRRRAEAGAGAVPRDAAARAGCRASSRSRPSARSPTSCRSSARTASSRSSASTCCRAGRTRSGLRALLDVAGLTGKTIDSYHISFMLAPRVNAAGRMSTPDIATRLLLASDEAMGDEARALALQLDGENVRRQEEEAEILAAAKKDRADRSRRRRPIGPRRRRRGLAPRRHRHRRLEAGRRLPSAGDRAVGRGRRRARLVPEHPALRHARRARALRAPVHPLRRAQAGGRPDAWRRRGSGSCARAVNDVADETLGPDDLMPRLRIDGDLTFRGITGGVASGVAVAGAVRRRQPAAGVRRRAASRSSTARASSRSGTSRWRSGRRAASSAPIAWRAAERHDYLDRAQGGARRRLLAGAEPVQWRDVRRADARRHQEQQRSEIAGFEDCRIAREPICNPAILQSAIQTP